jgi:acetyl-CoA/propionyl-CoA carboxylase carboxyl transferase subunit
VLAWPEAQVAVMGAVAAVRILHRRKLAEVPEDMRHQVELELAEEHERIAGGLDKARAIGVVDDEVAPDRTRSTVAQAIWDAVATHGDPADAANWPRGRHGNIPL